MASRGDVPFKPQEHRLENARILPGAGVQNPRAVLPDPAQHPPQGTAPGQPLPALRRRFPVHAPGVIVGAVVELPGVGGRVVGGQLPGHQNPVPGLKPGSGLKKGGHRPQLLPGWLQPGLQELRPPAVGLLLQSPRDPRDPLLSGLRKPHLPHPVRLRPSSLHSPEAQGHKKEQEPDPQAPVLSALQTGRRRQIHRQQDSHFRRMQSQYLSKYESPCKKYQRTSDFILLLYSPGSSQRETPERWNPGISH